MDDIENEFHFVCTCTIHGVEKYISCADPGIFARGGGLLQALPENRSDVFFNPQLILQWFINGLFQRKLYFYLVQRGFNIFQGEVVQHSPGGPTFSRGSKC